MTETDDILWFHLSVNPEPWAIGPVGSARRGGKLTSYVGRNNQVHSYEQAIKEAVTELLTSDFQMFTAPILLKLYFWRNRAEYTTPQARTHRKHEADLTNLQKSTEDACQNILFKNDKDVAGVHSVMVEQGPDVVGRVVIGVATLTSVKRQALLDKVPHLVLDTPEPSDWTQPELPYDDTAGEVF